MELSTDNRIRHQEILEACKKGDNRAQMEIYRLYYKPMYHVALRILGDQMEAEDVMQESFLVAFRNLGSVHLSTSFGGWLKKIVVNRSLDALRLHKNNVELMDDFPDEVMPQSSYQPDEDTVQEKISKVRRAMEKLPEKYRIILNLNLFEGYDHDEISQILGVPASTSRAQVSRGKQKLLALIGGLV
jgi:RNA polymerase sigma-70 factor (ECF subfamily)